MSEYEPDDSRDVTQSSHRAPGEPPRTGFREDGARLRAQAEQGELPSRGQQEQGQAAEAGGDRAIEGDAPEHPDRMGAFAGETANGGQEQMEQEEAQQRPDRWAQSADRETYTPEGK
ncbi:hypothetical protein ACWPM1_00375 [Tsuneonella sp. HG249]